MEIGFNIYLSLHLSFFTREIQNWVINLKTITTRQFQNLLNLKLFYAGNFNTLNLKTIGSILRVFCAGNSKPSI